MFYSYFFSAPRVLFYFLPMPPSAVAAANSRDPAMSTPTCSHHCIPNHAPRDLSDPSHRSNSDRVAMYCATVFCRRLIYSSIVNNTASSLDATVEVYLHLLSGVFRRSRTVKNITIWV